MGIIKNHIEEYGSPYIWKKPAHGIVIYIYHLILSFVKSSLICTIYFLYVGATPHTASSQKKCGHRRFILNYIDICGIKYSA